MTIFEVKYMKKFKNLISGVFIGIILSIFIFYIYNIFSNKNLKDQFLGKKLIEVNGKIWYGEALPNEALIDYYNLEGNIDHAEKEFASQIGLRIALANENGVTDFSKGIPSLNELIKIEPISEIELKKYYDFHLKKDGPIVFYGQSFDKIKEQLRFQLNNQKRTDIAEKKLQEYILSNKIKFLLPPFKGPPTDFNFALYPSRGNKNSYITFVNIYDYNDSKSIEVEKKLKNYIKNNSNQIKLISVNYPLVNDLNGSLFSRGEFCTKKIDENQFWNYHDRVFDSIENYKNKLSYEKSEKILINIVKELNMNEEQFVKCLHSPDSVNYVQNLRNKLNSVRGFHEVPSFYVNQRPLSITLNEIDTTLKSLR
ncbi:DsbA family protein [Silvanigrella aquatica]|uniref:Thioredoxin-like fold domain-containing protein n=1 Tax=Silvanigrella aquatica TaxID=1915309 RepID=A0A1L4D0Q3_9BACT|nr:thioredoxin domain-containing protein [Silvanigrella aquatica]APJ03779.1 hypothetical protein AXG55_07615 [Silvanigrella aquatica]